MNQDPLNKPYSLEGQDQATSTSVDVPVQSTEMNLPKTEAPSSGVVSDVIPEVKSFVIESEEIPTGFRRKLAHSLYMTFRFRISRSVLTGVITFIFMAATFFGALYAYQRKSNVQDSASSKSVVSNLQDQDVVVTQLLSKMSDEELQVRTGVETLVVNGDVAIQQQLRFQSQGKTLSFVPSEVLTGSQTYLLPDASGTICLSTNNCGFATQADLQASQASANVFAGAGISVSSNVITNTGVRSLNSQTGSITIQGNANQTVVTNNGTVLTIGTAQDIATTSSPLFNGVSLAGNLSLGSLGVVYTNFITQVASGSELTLDASLDQITFIANGRTFQFPTSGPASQTICTTGISCASGGGSAVLIAPGSAQTDNTADATIFLNDTGGGNLVQLQSSAVDRFVVTNTGDVTIAGSLTLNGDATIGNATTDRLTIVSQLLGATPLVFQGAVDNSFTTSFAFTNPTANRTITFADMDGTVCLTSGNCVGVGGSGDILNNGQGGTVRVGSNDANSVYLETNNADRLTIDANGDITFRNASDSTGQFVILDSTGNDVLRVDNNGVASADHVLTFDGSISAGAATLNYSGLGKLRLGNGVYDGAGWAGGTATTSFSIVPKNITDTSGAYSGIILNQTFDPASGTASFVGVNVNPVINQTGGANGDFTAFQIQPTVTAAGGTNQRLFRAGTSVNNDLFTISVTGAVLSKNSSNSTTAFQVQPSGSATPVLNVDTTNSRVGIGTDSPAASLDIVGSTTSIRILNSSVAPGVAVTLGLSDAAGLNDDLALTVGSSYYVFTDQGNFGLGTNTSAPTAKLHIVTTAALVGQIIQGGASQSSDLLQFQDSNGLINAMFSAGGNQLTLGRIAASGTVTQGKLVLSDGTTDNFGLTLQAATLTASRIINLPNEDGTVCTTGSVCSGYAVAGSDAITINGSSVTDANFINTTATGTVAGTTFSLNTVPSPDEITLTVSNASATVAGVITTGTQSIAGEKTFSNGATGYAIIVGNANEISTGGGIVVRADNISTGRAISIGGSNGGELNAISSTGALLAIDPIKDYGNGATKTEAGNFLLVHRRNTVTNALGTFNTTGDLALLQSANCAAATGTCTDSGKILNLQQNYTGASGTVLNVGGVGTGNLAVFDTTNSSANGISIDVQSSSASQYALKVTTNNGANTALQLDGDGDLAVDGITFNVDAANDRVGIRTASPSTPLHIKQPNQTVGLRVEDSAGSNAINIYVGSGNNGQLELPSTYTIGHTGSTTSGGTLQSGRVLTLKSFNNSTLGGITFDLGGTTIAQFQSDADFIVDTSTLYVDALNNQVGVGTTSNLGARLAVVGAADQEQLLIRANGTQSISNPLFLAEDNTGTELFRLSAPSASTILLGDRAGLTLVSSTDSVYIGSQVGSNNTTSDYNTAVGSNAFRNGSGSDNSVFGSYAGNNLASGNANTLIGSDAGYYLSSGSASNVVIGAGAALSATNGTMSNGTIIGTGAGALIDGGDNNILLGYQAGNNITSGDNNVVIGYDLDATSPTGSNQLHITNILHSSDYVNGNLEVGTVDTVGQLFVLDTKTDAGDPTGVAGGMYYNSNLGRFRCYDTKWNDCFPTRLTKSSDQTLSSNTNADISGIGFTVGANTDYAFECRVVFASVATTTGIGLAFTTPASPTYITYNALIPVGADGTGALYSGQGTASDDSVIGTGVEATGTNYTATMSGILRNGSNSGALTLRGATEVNASDITLKQGSSCTFTQL